VHFSVVPGQHVQARKPDCPGHADGDLVREETYINPLKKNSLGPREALCIDRQRCIHRSASGFVVERKVYTPKVGDCTSLLYITAIMQEETVLQSGST